MDREEMGDWFLRAALITAFILLVMLLSGLVCHGADTYSDAYNATLSDGTQAVVLVGATWCGPCKKVERYIPRLRTKGHYAHVDTDQEPALARELLKGRGIPTLAILRRISTDKLSVAERYTGPAEIRRFAEGK